MLPDSYVEMLRETVMDPVRSKGGRPYRWNAQGPFHFDCSGLVMWGLWHLEWFKEHMRDMSANEMAVSYFRGCEIEFNKAQSGDLVFYGRTVATINHVMLVNWTYGPGPFSLIGARGGDPDTVTDEAAYRAKAMVDIVRADYWAGSRQLTINPFLKLEG